VTDRHARGVLAVVIAALAVGLLWVDVAELSGRQFWSDGSTYYSMAWSLAKDADLRYEARDLLRVERQYGSRPQGVFLKRACGGLAWDPGGGFPWLGRVGCQEGEKRVYFAKAFAYPLAVAPFVAGFGNRGLLVFNLLCLGLTLALAYAEGRRRASPARALAVVMAIFGASVAPLYLLWLTPELFNLALIMAGLAAWRSERPLLAAVLLGVATYSKPYNLFVALPLGVAPLLPSAGLGWVRGFGESLRRGLVMGGVVVALFGVNKVVTGELNYQGGERKTFYGRFPLQPEPARLVGSSEMAKVTFGNSGQWMTTDHLGPIVEGRDEDLQSRRTGPLRAQSEIRESFLRNLGYFWLGRFAGAVPYYPAAVLALVLFLGRGPRNATGWLAVAALGVSYLFYIWMIPDNWYGGGGTVGNRYFLNLLPLAPFFVPRGREWLIAGGGLLGGVVFLGHMALAPMRHSLQPGLHATRAAFRHFPAELTMLNDLSVFTERWRKKRPVGDTEGDAHKHWPADPKAYYLYFTDNGTHGRETLGEETGFWLRGRGRAEVILRALEPVRRMTFRVTGGRAGDDVTIQVGGSEERLAIGAGQTREVTLDTEPGFQYYDSFVHVLRFRSRRGAAAHDGRPLGSFVHISLEVDKRPRP
jgi:hypothetical protein